MGEKWVQLELSKPCASEGPPELIFGRMSFRLYEHFSLVSLSVFWKFGLMIFGLWYRKILITTFNKFVFIFSDSDMFFRRPFVFETIYFTKLSQILCPTNILTCHCQNHYSNWNNHRVSNPRKTLKILIKNPVGICSFSNFPIFSVFQIYLVTIYFPLR